MFSITRSVLSDQVKDYLLQGILTGSYPPGARIVETRVARDLGTSQAPVREALRDLEALGVVEITRFQGARVRESSRSELAGAYGVRAELESYGVRLAIPRVAEGDLEELRGYIDEMQRAAFAGDTLAEARLDATFHGRVVEIASNTTLTRVWQFLEPMSRTYITHVAHRIDPFAIVSLHQPILDALTRKDPDGASAAVRRHFRIAGEMFEETNAPRPAIDAAGTGPDGGAVPKTRKSNLARRRLAGASGTDRSKEHE